MSGQLGHLPLATIVNWPDDLGKIAQRVLTAVIGNDGIALKTGHL